MNAMSQWICPTCGKFFIRKGDLTRHRLLHTGLKPHVCEECGKAFSQGGALKTHRNIHSNLKPFKCGVHDCDAAFGDPSSCSRHRKEIHYHVGRYRCPAPDCSSSIKRRSAYTAHLKRHGIDPRTVATEHMNSTPLFSKRPPADPINQSPSTLYSTVFEQRYSPELPTASSSDHSTFYCNLIDSPPAMSTHPYDYKSRVFMSTNAIQPFNETRSPPGQSYFINSPSPSLSPPSLIHSLSPSPSPSYSSKTMSVPSYLATPPRAGHASPFVPTLSPLLNFPSLPQLNFSTSSGNEADTTTSDYPKWDIDAFLRELEKAC